MIEVLDVELRELRTAAELAPLPELERRVWGGESEMVSINVLVATISEGGVAIGAFDGERLVGAVYGFATSDPHVHHSHYLAVDAPYRRSGLGEVLKRRQRAWCLARGITAMRWTYDPLQYGNAHLNLRRLGAFGIAYHVDHYGSLGGINGSLPSDRVTVRWELDGSRPAVAEQRVVAAPAITPADITAAADAALTARHELRAALAPLLDDGWLMVDVDRAAPSYTVAR
ncbi:MAG: GNAT family N-acetyltransferase [Ilumatobacteraceae bacterium]